MGYELDISIDPKGVERINGAGQFVTIVKEVSHGGDAAAESTGPLPVAWLSIVPESTNKLTWDEQYWLYETDVQVQAGVVITQGSQTTDPADSGNTYEFVQGEFQNAKPGLAAGEFGVLDQADDSVPRAFGLSQQCMVGGTMVTSPINAINVLNTQTAIFQPYEKVSIFLASYADNGTVISQVTGNALTVEVMDGTTPSKVTFNDATNSFELS
jgi:hypothetical protein